MLREYTQGFYGTGEYYLLLEDEGYLLSNLVPGAVNETDNETDDEDDGSEKKTRIHIISFNKDEVKYEHKILNVELQYCELKVTRKFSRFHPSIGKFIHLVERLVNEEIVLELYYINVVDFFAVKFNETTIKCEDINLRLSYDARIYNRIRFDFYKDGSLLTCQAFCYPTYDNENYHPWFSIDFIRTDQGKLCHLRRLTFELDVQGSD